MEHWVKKWEKTGGGPYLTYPSLSEIEQPFWNAFQALNQRRPSSFGMALIPFSEILSYFEIYQIDHPWDREDIANVVLELDAYWVSKYPKKDK